MTKNKTVVAALNPDIFSQAQTEIDTEKVKNTIWHGSLQDMSVGGITTFNAYISNMMTVEKKVKTGIKELDKILGGGYCIGLTMVGGVPNAGKTTMLVQSAVEMSRQGINSVFISYDMRGYALMDKVYSRISYLLYQKEGYSLQDLNKKKLLEDNEKNKRIIEEVIKVTQNFSIVDMLQTTAFDSFAGGLLEVDGYDDIEKVIRIYADTYQNPVFFIDNLQQMSGYLGYDGKSGIDKTLRLLKKYSSVYNVAIVIISTLGRASYNKDLGLEAFKESGNIDYDTDAAFVIQPKFIGEDEKMTIDDFREQNERDVAIKAIKGRDFGFQKSFITLNAPYCTFELYDPDEQGGKEDNKSKIKESKNRVLLD
ncbi:hypothetical protein IZY60_12705 [Lutibacter sp. B2]|nr:hypothetical protein [Lutibacter sp. B2]